MTPSQALSQELYGSPPYSAAVAVTASGTTVTGTNVNGSGCDFGIYVAQGVSNVTISQNDVHDAFQEGIMVDGATSVNVQGNQVSQTGWHDQNGWDPNGVQTGLGIYYLAASGDISSNFVTTYQKNGITANYLSNVSLEQNVVTGMGSPSNPTTFIAQNGIQVYESNMTAAWGNFASFNYYGPPSYGATGYLICASTYNGQSFTKKQFEKGFGYGKNVAMDNNYNYYVANSC